MELTGETTHLALLEGRFVVYIDKIEPDRSIRMVSRLGARLPAHCTSLGKAILARLADGEVESLLAGVRLEKPTPHSAGTLREVLARLEPVRRSGYAVDDEEAELGLRCVGAAVTDGQGQTRTAVSLAAPLERMSSARVAELGGLVTQTALDVGRDLGSLAARQGAM
jgi:DNA-binding IclR family transcriptional regulator